MSPGCDGAHDRWRCPSPIQLESPGLGWCDGLHAGTPRKRRYEPLPMTITPGLLPEGLRDRLPPQAEAGSRLLHRVIVAIGRHGYARVTPPLAEFEEGLVGRLKTSRAQDLLRFVDPVSQRTLA